MLDLSVSVNLNSTLEPFIRVRKEMEENMKTLLRDNKLKVEIIGSADRGTTMRFGSDIDLILQSERAKEPDIEEVIVASLKADERYDDVHFKEVKGRLLITMMKKEEQFEIILTVIKFQDMESAARKDMIILTIMK